MFGHSTKLWVKSFIWGLGIVALCIGYKYLQIQEVTPYTFNASIAFSAIFLILTSHALSGTSYFWGIGKSRLGYRKALGVVGLIFGLFHAIGALLLYAGGLFNIVFFQNNILSLIAADLAVLLFIFMVAISNFGMPAKLGALRWRRWLRTSGYIGIVFITIHFTLFSLLDWKFWLETFSPILPPLSLLLVLFSVFTLSLRLALWQALAKKSNAAKPTS